MSAVIMLGRVISMLQGEKGPGQAGQTTFTHAPGNYTSSSVPVTTPTPSAIIRYTVNGSTPSLTGPKGARRHDIYYTRAT
jgi:chitobiase/beta-hexosaminidase-like protein